jgi:hypothetical protein
MGIIASWPGVREIKVGRRYRSLINNLAKECPLAKRPSDFTPVLDPFT